MGLGVSRPDALKISFGKMRRVYTHVMIGKMMMPGKYWLKMVKRKRVYINQPNNMRPLIILVVGMMLVGSGCEGKPTYTQQAIDACISKGGIPYLTEWGATVRDCVFPPK